MEKKEQGTVQALERGLKILELLMQEKRPMGVNEIAKCQGITPSAAYRILKTLEANGWSFQMSDDKYIPGEKLSYVTEKNNFHLALAEVAYPVMQELTAREILPMNLVVRQDRRFFILQQTRTNAMSILSRRCGSALPLHASAGGKILLCELPGGAAGAVSGRNFVRVHDTEHHLYQAQLLEELDKVRQQGYALDYFESLSHTCCVAVPVRSPEGEIYAALSFSGITDVTSREQLAYYLPQLREAAQTITRRAVSAARTGLKQKGKAGILQMNTGCLLF